MSCVFSLAPVLEGDEAQAAVADHSTGENVETGEGDDILHVRVGHGDLVELVSQRLGASECRCVRQHDGRDEVALILIRYQFPRYFHKQQITGEQHGHYDAEGQCHPAIQESHPTYISSGELVKAVIEPDEEASGFLMAILEQDSTQGR